MTGVVEYTEWNLNGLLIMSRDLKILEANVNKAPMVMQSLFNDDEFSDFSLFLLSEPHCFLSNDKLVSTPAYHPTWSPVWPSKVEPGRWPVRSMIWAHRDLHTKALDTNSSDVAAALVYLEDRLLLAVSVYIPSDGANRDQNLFTRLECIRSIISKTQNQYPRQELDFLVAGDFNRHDQLWGGDRVALTQRQGEAAGIIDLMRDYDLQSLLPRGTDTYSGPQGISTVDLVLASPRLAENRITCDTISTQHGSDHDFIQASFDTQWTPPTPEPRLLFKSAPWPRLRQTISSSLQHQPILLRGDDIDSYLDRLMALVISAIEQHVPRAKPSQYAKRWWTTGLSTLRSDYTYWRNQARAARRIGPPDQVKEQRARVAKTEYFKAIKSAKRTHWNDFLDNTDNVWKAAKYLDPDGASAFARIPALTDGHNIAESNEDIAYALRHTFFPPLPPQSQGQPIQQPPSPLQCPALTEWEVKRAIFDASPWKAPGMDGLPAAVWQQLWPVIRKNVVELFQASLRIGRVPSQWKVAKIIPLRKPNKPDYTVPKAYRPISLLATLGKAMEAVIAERISYLVESEAQLLPKNHFGARKRRSAVQAMMVLQEKIFEAWRNRRVLSLVNFDVKGAYNGVAKEVLLERLKSRRMPQELVRWIDDFCANRRASIVANGMTSAVTDLQQAGLPQGSPLSPILFLFFNADLVQTVINCNQGAIAFIDDYTAWVTGLSADDNTRQIQESIIPRATRWETESGATFETDKTSFIHFTRSAAKGSNLPLQIKGEQIVPRSEVKILGVIFDQELRFSLHAARAAKRGLQAAMAMKRLKGLRPNSARQIFSATVAPVIDYASSVWLPVVKEKFTKLLEPAQRIAAQAITGAFRTVALSVAVAEASIYPLQHRFHYHNLRFWVDIHTLPKSHPLWKLLRSIDTRNTRFKSPLQLLAMTFPNLDLSSMEIIRPFCLPPWQPGATTFIEEYDMAIHTAQSELQGDRPFFTDGSIRNGLAGVGVAIPTTSSQAPTFLTRSYTLAKGDEVNAYFMELAAVQQAVAMITDLCTPDWITSIVGRRTTSFRIFTDSQSALKVLKNPRRQSGQFLIREIICQSQDLLSRGGPTITFHWVPGHANVLGNETAHIAARAATEIGTWPKPGSKLLKTAAIRLAKQRPMVDYFHKSSTGRFTKELDRALPARHTRKLYDKRPRKESAILSQLRSGMSRLNSSLAKIKAIDSDQCECGERETVQHFLFHCPRWQSMRDDFRKKAGQRWGDLSFALGGWSGRRLPDGKWLDGKLSSWKPNLEIVRATIDFAMRTGRLDFRMEGEGE